jgi:hypothetical protein
VSPENRPIQEAGSVAGKSGKPIGSRWAFLLERRARVEDREKLQKLTAEQGGRLTLEKGDDAKELRRALKAAAAAVNRRVRFPFRGEEGSLSFYLEGQRGRRRGRRPKAEAGAPKRRGRPRKATS